ncbi:MAG: wcaJ [Verrucomicrobiaceae bacterium]|nr:wcaJ [Verrucomicrobiaceae bacterium]
MGIHEIHANIDIFPFSSPSSRRPRRLLQNHDTILHHLQIVLSIISSAGVLMALAWWRDGEVRNEYRSMAVIAGLLMLVIYKWRGVFRRFDGNSPQRLALSWVLVVALVIATGFFTKTSEDFSRAVISCWMVFGFILQLVGHHLSYRVSQKLRVHFGQPIRAVVMGSARVAEHLVTSINKNGWMADRIIGVVDDSPTPMSEWKSAAVNYLGSFNQIMEIIEKHQVNRVYLALPISCAQMVERIYKDVSGVSIDVVWVPDIFNMQLLNHSVRELNGLPLITLSESPMMSETQLFGKTLMDRVIAICALIMLSPLMLVIAFTIWLSSPGPIFFKQKRHGWDGRIIDVWKFRSMYVHNDAVVQQASKNDSRITPIGRFIRRSSIDELPQLFNVLEGTMSLVGPRPHALAHNGFYSQYIRCYMMRHRIKPGMTGLAQVNGLRGETDTLEKMLARVEMDIEYINKWSLWLDVEILLKTPLSLFSKNAY